MKPWMQTASYFLWSSALLLLVTGVAKLYSLTGTSRFLAATDPVFHLSNREVMLLVGLLELVVAIYLVLGRDTIRRAAVLLWLGANFLGYRAAGEFLQAKLCPCLGTISSHVPLTQAQLDRILGLMVAYFLAGSTWILYKTLRSRAKRPVPMAGGLGLSQ